LATTKNRSSFSFVSTAFGRAWAASDFSIISAIAKHSRTAGVRDNVDLDGMCGVVFVSEKSWKILPLCMLDE
jgi:hypothetical protein